MPQIASFDDVKATRKQREIPGGYAWRTNFLHPPEGVREHPMAFLAEGTPGRVIKPHFHEVDQFQVIVHGGGVLGRHDLAIHAVHFSRKHTPYGPIVAGGQGLGFLTLRAHWDPGAQYLADAETMQKLKRIPERKPWQATELPRFASAPGMSVRPFDDIRDERGLAAYSVTLGPDAQGFTPDPSTGNGQYVIVTRGGIFHEGRGYAAISIGFSRPHEGPFRLQAGAEGAEVLVLNFPRAELAAHQVKAVASAPRFRVWQCELCSFVYDEAQGLPQEGIAAGTRWEDVPADWICPDCATGKADFRMSEVG